MSLLMKILLFDIDGTLLLTGGVGTRSFQRAFRQRYGLEPDMSCYSPWGNTDFEIARTLLEHHFPARKPMPTIEITGFLDEYLRCFHEALPQDDGFRLMPAALACIEQFGTSPHHLVGVATGNLSKAAWAKLERGGLRPWIRFGGFAEDGEQRADILRAAKQRGEALAGPGPHEWWVIGDTPKDIAAARTIGAHAVAVATGKFTAQELTSHQPDVLLSTLTELMTEPHRLFDSI